MTSRRNKSYPIHQCALYKCRTKKKLFELLQTTPTKLKELREAPKLYHPIKVAKKDGTYRDVLAPRGDLKRIQKRVGELLLRVQTPDYLMAPVRGRSNIDNAVRHRGARSFHLLDVADFYPSCSANKVAAFYGKTLGCPPDVVKILLELTTLNGALPPGSPASPSLAFWAYQDMWDEIAEISEAAGCTLTVYVDDITISGHLVPGEVVYGIKERLKHHGHSFKKQKEAAQIDGAIEATGVILTPSGKVALPNTQHQSMHQLRTEVQKMPEGPEKELKASSLRGREINLYRILQQNTG
jgi:hypothetical protein